MKAVIEKELEIVNQDLHGSLFLCIPTAVLSTNAGIMSAITLLDFEPPIPLFTHVSARYGPTSADIRPNHRKR